MEHQKTGSNLHRQHDDWDEVHRQMIEVQEMKRIQKKSLQISNPGGSDEKEADEVARKVMSGESAEIHGSGGTINRKDEGGSETTPEFQSQLNSSKGGGQPLNESTRGEMESKMGADFSGVKIHTGSDSHQMNESVSAKAFTHGSDIYFGEGEYNPQSSSGKELIAHELVHTVQQGSEKTSIQRSGYGEPVEKTINVTEGNTTVEVIDSIGQVVKTFASGSVSSFSFTIGDEIPPGLYSLRFSSASENTVERISKIAGTDIVVKVNVAHDAYRYEKGKIGTLSDLLTAYPHLNDSVIKDLPAVVIMQTAEFKELMNPELSWQLCYNLDYDEAVYICRKVLKEMIKIPPVFVWDKDVEQIILDALKTQGSASEEAKYYNRLIKPEYQTLCTGFETAISTASGLSNIEKLVRDYADALWKVPRDKRDDGSLYVARIRGRRALKTNVELTSSREGIQEMVKMFKLLDDISRGREDVVFKDNDDTRILISGFDPFQGGRTNPSGTVVQMMDGTTMTYTQGSTTKTAQIEGVIFPTKYSDFDKGAVEKFFDPYLDPKQGKNISAVITISKDGNTPSYYLERHAARYRGSMIRDNAGIGTSEFMQGGSYSTPTYYEDERFWRDSRTAGVLYLINQNLERYANDGTVKNHDWKFITIETLDKIKALFSYINFSSCPPIPDIIKDRAEALIYLKSVDQWLSTVAATQQQELLSFPEGTKGSEFYSTSFNLDHFPTSGTGLVEVRNTYSTFPNNAEDSPTVDPDAQRQGMSNEGSGSNFMSNEIYYRVSVLAEKYGRAVPNIHLHIPDVGQAGTPTKDKLKENIELAIRLALESHVHK